MPGFNQNGPAGQGPMSGRGMGVCSGDAGFSTTAGRGAGRGGGWCRNANFGRRMAGCRGGEGMEGGRGAGLGAGRFAAQQPVATEDTSSLKAAYDAAERNLVQLKERLDALKKGARDPEDR